MTLTAKQRERRKSALGASDIPAVLGRDPFRSPYDLWLEKSGRTPEEPDNSRFDVANALEPAILMLAEKKLGSKIVKPKTTFTHPGGVILANVDGMVDEFKSGQPIVEAKSTCIDGGWGDPDTDQVPDRVLIQVQIQMACAGSKVAHVARLLGKFGFKFEMYRVLFDAELAAELIKRAHAFWQGNVLADVAPEITPLNVPSLDLLGKIDREDKAVEVPPALVAEYLAANEARKAAEKTEDEIKARLVASLGDAERGTVPGFTVKYGFTKTCKFSPSEFEAAHPDLFNRFKRDGGYRKLLVSAEKPAKASKSTKE